MSIAGPSAWNTLSKREKAVLRLIATGLTLKEVACVLDCSIVAVEKFRNNIHRKLGVDNAVQVAHWALAYGYVELLYTKR